MSALPVAWTSEELEPFLELVRPWLEPQPDPTVGGAGWNVVDRALERDRDPLVLALLQVRREQRRAEGRPDPYTHDGRDPRLAYLQELVDGLALAWQCLLEAQGQQRYVWQSRVGHIRTQVVVLAQELAAEQRGGA